MSEQEDHDLLIKIANDISWLKDSFIDHMKEDAENISEIKRVATAAHARMDKILIGGVMALVVLAITIYFK